MSGAYAPFGTGAGALPGGESSVWLGATALSTSAIASIDSRMALPTAVRRPVASVVTTSSRTSWSVVGAWTISAKPAKATIPIWVVELWLSMNVVAAASAASSRLGAMSVAHMLRETSMARMTVVWPAGTTTIATGPGHRQDQAGERRGRTTRTAGGAGCATTAGAASRISDRLE